MCGRIKVWETLVSGMLTLKFLLSPGFLEGQLTVWKESPRNSRHGGFRDKADMSERYSIGELKMGGPVKMNSQTGGQPDR